MILFDTSVPSRIFRRVRPGTQEPGIEDRDTCSRPTPTTLAGLTLLLSLLPGCAQPPEQTVAEEPTYDATQDASSVTSEVEAAVWTFHAADVARDAEAVIQLLWPEFTTALSLHG